MGRAQTLQVRRLCFKNILQSSYDFRPSPISGIYYFSRHSLKSREMPTETDEITHQTVHSSVLSRKSIREDLRLDLKANPSLIAPLLPFEGKLKEEWAQVEIKKEVSLCHIYNELFLFLAEPGTDNIATAKIESKMWP